MEKINQGYQRESDDTKGDPESFFVFGKTVFNIHIFRHNLLITLPFIASHIDYSAENPGAASQIRSGNEHPRFIDACVDARTIRLQTVVAVLFVDERRIHLKHTVIMVRKNMVITIYRIQTILNHAIVEYW
jgi:hypothetical protein